MENIMSPSKRSPKGTSDEAPHPDPTVPQLTLRLIRKALYPIPRHGPVTCRLWRMRTPDPATPRTLYAVDLQGLGTRRLHILGPDRARALAVFDLLVQGTVTPCALRDVLEELPPP